MQTDLILAIITEIVHLEVRKLRENFSQIDLEMTRRAIELASFGVGQVSPNPLVGCVITAENGEIVGEGTYIFDNVIHAEVIALTQAGTCAKGGTAYVSLEPHNHQNRTPPCTEALINAGIKRVVCPIEDANPLVAGSGFERLRQNNIEVVTGISADEAKRQNEKFICWYQKNRPFVHLKLAMSLDGRISLQSSVSTTLSGKESAKRVQDFRHEHDAILVGGNTAFVDNPSLTDRSSKPRRCKLVRVVLDNRLQIPLESTLVQTANEIPTIIFSNSANQTKITELRNANVDIVELDARNLHEVLAALRGRDLQSVLVEGGTAIAGAFVDAKLVDKISLMIAPIIIGGNTAPNAIGGNGAMNLAETLKLENIEIIKHGEDIEITGYPKI
jgi:diaminohydroxyphosphoribosylaminopyrimidine deaminase / 5-amino-6-(5-phosphoribosylamino)uracil reductase